MKQIKCTSCTKKWYVDEKEVNLLLSCPFCETPIKKKMEITDLDTLGKAIYKAIEDCGMDILSNTSRISGYLFDMAPNLKKEIRIFSKIFDNDYLKIYRNAFGREAKEVELDINKLRKMFVEEEGLSEVWADMICVGCIDSIMYFQGYGLPEVIMAEISDTEFVVKKQNINSNLKNDSKTSEIKSSNPVLEGANFNVESKIVHSAQMIDKWQEKDMYLEEAKRYYLGKDGYSKDERKAIKLFREVANRHQYVLAYNFLGEIYCRKRYYEKAYNWYKKSADKGDTEGLCMIGVFLQNGKYNGYKMGEEAKKYYLKAANTGNYKLMLDIALKVQLGKLVPKDEEIAANIIEVVADKGDAEGLCMMGVFLQNGKYNGYKMREEAKKYYLKAANTGNYKLMLDIALKIQSGKLMPKDEEIAADIIEVVANKGDKEALYQLGICYKEGRGRKVDIPKAASILKTLKDDNNKLARDLFMQCLGEMSFKEKVIYNFLV